MNPGFEIEDYEQYMEDIATAHKKIDHFFTMDQDLIIKQLRDTIQEGETVMLLDRIDFGYLNPTSDNFQKILMGGVWILKNTGQSAAEKIAAYNETSITMDDIFSRFLRDKRECFFINEFNPADVNGMLVGPMYDNHFGSFAQYPLHVNTEQNLFYDESKWL